MYCPFCGNVFREGDDCTHIVVGNMAWGDGSLALFCDPYTKPSGRKVETLLHASCFCDGPLWEESELVAIHTSIESINQPRCTVCDELLMPGEQVFMFQNGTIANGKFEVGNMAFISQHMFVRAAYAHTECVCAEAAVHLPQPPEVYIPV